MVNDGGRHGLVWGAGLTRKREYDEVAFAFRKLIVPHLDEDLAKQMLKKEWLPPESAKPVRD